MWALFAIGAAVVCGVCYMISAAFDGKNKGGATALFAFLGAVAGVGAIGSGVIALIRFIKWVWG